MNCWRRFGSMLCLLSMIFLSSCSLDSATRQKLNGTPLTSGKFDPKTGSYCQSGLGEWLDKSSVKLMNLVPLTYCLFDAFGVDRSVVLSVLIKYNDRKSLTQDEAKEIIDTLHVTALVDKIIRSGAKYSFEYGVIQERILIASLDKNFVPEQLAIAGVDDAAEAIAALSALGLAIPAFQRFLESNPDILNKAKDGITNSISKISDILKSVEIKINDDLCKNLKCETVSVNIQEMSGPGQKTPCPPCKLIDGTVVAVGTIGYRYDKLPPDKEQHGIKGDHLNLYICNQNPNNCQCFWQRSNTVSPPPQPGWIPIQNFLNSPGK